MRVRLVSESQCQRVTAWQHSFVEIDHEVFATVILSLPLIQEGQLSVSGERKRIILVYRLEDSACPVKNVVRKHDHNGLTVPQKLNTNKQT